MRKYERTHPWINFRIDLSRAPAKLWLALGEARSKCEHIAGVPLTPLVARELHQVYLAKGAWATTAIEGNTLSEKEVRKQIEGQLKLPFSQEYLGQEINNIVNACSQITANVNKPEFVYLKWEQIQQFNRQVLQNLTLDEGVVPGEIPTYSVGVADYLGAPRQDCTHLMNKMCEWLNDSSFLPEGNDRLIFGLLRAIIAHLYLVWIHPFGDGNGRTSRLLEYQILLSAGVPTPAAHLLSNHYNLTRPEYYRQLQASSKSGDPLPFLLYALTGFVEGLHSQLEVIRDLQWAITWDHYIHDQFRTLNSPSDNRRRHLILDLSQQKEPVAMQGITRISPRVAAEYAGKTTKTVMRDLNFLSGMGLVERTRAGYRARREEILQFLPLRREEALEEIEKI